MWLNILEPFSVSHESEMDPIRNGMQTNTIFFHFVTVWNI